MASMKDQRALIRRLLRGPTYEVVRTLYDFLDSTPDIPLDPGWKRVWGRVRDEVIRDHLAPQGVIADIDRAIGAIQHIEEGISSIHLDSDHHVVFLLGAGASAPQPSSIPTVMELLPELWRRARKLGRDDIDRLAAWCEARGITNIEDLLTAAYLANFSAKSPSVSGLLNYFLFKERHNPEPRHRYGRSVQVASQVDAASVALFQETLQGLFGLLTSTMIPAAPNSGHAAIVDFICHHPQAAIITTNYDGCIDEAIIGAKVKMNTYITDGAGSPAARLDLIKMHGSINWTYCDSCHEVKEFPVLELKKGFERDTVSYAVVGICKNCGGQRRPLLIPPMGLKFVMFPNLIRLWNLARDHIERAYVIVVVGFSFSEADSYIAKIIERSMSFNREQRLVICDPNSSLVSILRARYGARIERFKESRILAAVGSSEEIVPKVLTKLTEHATASSEDMKPGGRTGRRGAKHDRAAAEQ